MFVTGDHRTAHPEMLECTPAGVQDNELVRTHHALWPQHCHLCEPARPGRGAFCCPLHAASAHISPPARRAPRRAACRLSCACWSARSVWRCCDGLDPASRMRRRPCFLTLLSTSLPMQWSPSPLPVSRSVQLPCNTMPLQQTMSVSSSSSSASSVQFLATAGFYSAWLHSSKPAGPSAAKAPAAHCCPPNDLQMPAHAGTCAPRLSQVPLSHPGAILRLPRPGCCVCSKLHISHGWHPRATK